MQLFQDFKTKIFVDRRTPKIIFLGQNTFLFAKKINIDLTCSFRPLLGSERPLWWLLFCSGIISINPRFINIINILKHTFNKIGHSTDDMSDFQAKVSLLCHGQFWNPWLKFPNSSSQWSILYFAHSQPRSSLNRKLHTLDIIRCSCRWQSTWIRVTVNRYESIFRRLVSFCSRPFC